MLDINWRKKAKLFFKLVLWLSLWVLIVWHLYQKDPTSLIDRLQTQILQKNASFAKNTLFFLLLLASSALNWSLEALKWQVLCRPLLPLSFSSALGGVLSGLALSVGVPLGNLLGRAWRLHDVERKKVYALAVLNSATQSWVTFFGGAVAAIFYSRTYGEAGLAVALLLLIMLLAWLLKSKYLQSWFAKRGWSAVWVLHQARQRWAIVGYSLLRYGVFCSQFAAVLGFLEAELSLWELFVGVSLTYLLKSLLPFFNLFLDLGLREGAALLVFSAWAVSPWVVLSASLLVWLFNLFLPTVFGLVWSRRWWVSG
jgi:hypothetical protein